MRQRELSNVGFYSEPLDDREKEGSGQWDFILPVTKHTYGLPPDPLSYAVGPLPTRSGIQEQSTKLEVS